VRRLRQTAAVAVLILDDFGMKPLSEAQQSDLHELICERYEQAPTIITSNRDFNEWPMIFANPLMGSAAMDRLVHRASKIVIEGNEGAIGWMPSSNAPDGSPVSNRLRGALLSHESPPLCYESACAAARNGR
jgi:hypothetical protein